MNYSIWDKLDEKIEEKANIEKATAPNKSGGLTAQNHPKFARNTSPLPETPPEPKSPQNARESHTEPVFDEAKFWEENKGIIASVPVESIIPLKLGLIEEHILSGLRTGADRTGLFLAASLGVALANNDRLFYTQVKDAIAK